MTSRPRALPTGRHALAAPIAVAVLLAAAACGSGDSTAGPAPASGTPTTASRTHTPEPTPSETPTATPLSPYEDEATVKVLREWAVILGKGIPKRDVSDLSKVSQGEALREMAEAAREDFGREYPGPLPLTPVRVKTSGTHAEVTFCMQTKGWALDPKTHAQVDGRRVVAPAVSTFTKTHGRWVMTTWYAADIDCSQIPVKGVAW